MKKKNSVTVKVEVDTTAGDLALARIPANARVSVRHEKYYNQFDSGGDWITFTWEEEF